MAQDEAAERVDAVDRLLPQTQCGRCGYDGCRPYAEAIVREQVPVNRCPPGGEAGIVRLADLLRQAPLPLDESCGTERPRRVARIVADLCIGCTQCIQACPVDAIAGASNRLHAVIAELCTGCDLCLPPCPVDCIEMVPPEPAHAGWNDAQAQAARHRYQLRGERLERQRHRDDARREAKAATKLAAPGDGSADSGNVPNTLRKRAVIEAAIARARARAFAKHPSGHES